MSISFKYGFSAILLQFVVSTGAVFAQHGGDHQGTTQKSERLTDNEKALFQKINEDYIKAVRPVFEAKCFAYHASTNAALPWYSNMPFAKGLIISDMKKAKEHLDMTNDFPFKGHGTALDDLKTIRASIEKQEMPPFRFRLLHRNSNLSPQEIDVVTNWTRTSIDLLNER